MAKKSKNARAQAQVLAADVDVAPMETTTIRANHDLSIIEPLPNVATALANAQERLLADLDAIIRMVEGTGTTHDKIARPFKRAAEDKLRALGWAVLDPKMVAHMQKLNGQKSAERAQREATKAEAAVVAARAKAEKLKAEAEAKLQAAEERVKALQAKAGVAA